MIDSVSSLTGTDADRTFYRQVVAHHREGIQRIDRMLPQLTGQARQMAQKSRAERQCEIPEFEHEAMGMTHR